MSYEINAFYGINTYNDLPEDLVPGIAGCIDSAFGGGITEEDAKGHMAGDQVLVATADLQRGGYSVAGFSSTSIATPADLFKNPELSSEKGAYFAGAAISSDAQGSGLYHELNSRRMAFAVDQGARMIFTRTQNPRVEEGITSSLERLVDQGKIGRYALSRTLVPGAYGKMLTAEKPVGRRVVYDLDYDRGDANVLTWQILD